MGLSRSQCSRQIVYLLQATNVLGASTSAFESTLAVEDYLASGLTFPIAVVETLESRGDQDVLGRLGSTRFRVSVAGGAVTETKLSNYVVSGGSASSQRTLESTIRQLLTGMNSTAPGSFTDSAHGFQGFVESTSQERIVVARGKSYAVSDFDVVVFNPTYADFYHAPVHFSATVGSSHSIDLAWTNPPSRFDQYQNILRRGTSPGDAAPTTTSGGTGITITGGVLGTAANDGSHSASQTFNYSLFRLYTAVSTGDQVSVRATASATTT